MCENMERPRSSGNSKKSNLNRLTSNDEAINSAACRAQSNGVQIYIGVGKWNVRPVILDSMVIPGSSVSLQMVDHTLIDVPLSNVFLDSLYYKGHCKMMCVSSPMYPVIIGNVRGARQMLPDPDWKAEDLRGAQDRTSVGNNNDDDNQSSDMPS